MQSWKCSTESVGSDDRLRVWGEALAQISLPATQLHDQSGFHGDVSSIVSPMGIAFSRVASSAQTLAGACTGSTPGLWLALPVQGVFRPGAAGGQDLGSGDILYGPTGCDSTLRLTERFVMLYISIPGRMLHPRMLNLRSLRQGTLDGGQAVNRIFCALLRAVVDDLDEMTEEHIRPIEMAVSEFVISSLAQRSALGCFDLATASNFARICQAIETHLGDGDLTLHHIADQQRVSTRYIQKLFQQAGLSFGPYLRQRRLEHCRADLISPALRGLSISDICFRWGFNDAAHFSRSFRAEYGTTPRAFRQDQAWTPTLPH